MDRIKLAFFMAIFLISNYALAERYEFKTNDGKFIEYRNKDLVKVGEWSDDISTIAMWSGNATEDVGLDGASIEGKEIKYGCRPIGNPVKGKASYVYIRLDVLDRNGVNGFGVYIDYPEGYTCNPSSKEINDALAGRIRKTKIEMAELEERTKDYKPEPEVINKVEFGGFVATREDILTSVLLACYTGSLDSGGWPSISTQERTNRYKALLSLHDDSPASMQRITNAYNFALKNLSDRYPLDTMAKYRGSVCDQMVMKGKL